MQAGSECEQAEDPQERGGPSQVALEVILMGRGGTLKQAPSTGKLGETEGSRGACSFPKRVGLGEFPALLWPGHLQLCGPNEHGQSAGAEWQRPKGPSGDAASRSGGLPVVGRGGASEG